MTAAIQNARVWMLAEPVNEEGTVRITGVLQDELGAAIPGGSITTLTVTLRDQATSGVINSRDGQNINGANGGSVDGSGNFALVLLPADNPIVTPANAEAHAVELHVALIHVTYGAGRGDWFEIVIPVRQIVGVPAS